MRDFKFFTDNESDYLEEVPTISRYDDYDCVVFDRIRYEANPIEQVHRFEIGGDGKAIIIRDIVQNPNLPLVEIVYELYHIYPDRPNIMHNRIITMSVDEYNEVRYDTI